MDSDQQCVCRVRSLAHAAAAVAGEHPLGSFGHLAATAAAWLCTERAWPGNGSADPAPWEPLEQIAVGQPIGGDGGFPATIAGDVRGAAVVTGLTLSGS
jgi:hypothetical protein